jgi:hypothetical protein
MLPSIPKDMEGGPVTTLLFITNPSGTAKEGVVEKVKLAFDATFGAFFRQEVPPDSSAFACRESSLREKEMSWSVAVGAMFFQEVPDISAFV